MYRIIDFEELDKITLDIYDSIKLDNIPIYLSNDRIIFNRINPFNIEKFLNKLDEIISKYIYNKYDNVLVNIIADPIIINNIIKFNYYYDNNSLYYYNFCKSNKLISSDSIFIVISINNSIIYCIKDCHDFISGKESEMKTIDDFKIIEYTNSDNTNIDDREYKKAIYFILLILFILYIIK